MQASERADLEQTLAAHGLTVVLTRDYNTMLLELATLKRDQRLTRDGAEEHF